MKSEQAEMEHLTMQEEAAMRRIWRLGSATVKQLLEQYGSEALPYTTLASIVKNLERKNFVKAEREGIGYRYRPLVTEEEYKRSSLGTMVSNYFAGSYRQVVNFFVENQQLSKEELQEIIGLIEDGGEG